MYIKTTVVDSPQTKYWNDTTENNVLKHFDKTASTFLLKCITESVFCEVPEFGNVACDLHQMTYELNKTIFGM